MRAFRLFFIIALFVLSAAAVAARPASGPQLDLQRTGVLAAAPGLAASPVAGYAIIQFAGPIATADRAALEATGAAILEYLPDFAYLVRGTPEQLDAAARVPHVYR